MLRKNKQPLQAAGNRICDDNQQFSFMLKDSCGEDHELFCQQVPYRPMACQGKIYCKAGSAQIAA
jgi:hypothetical protein